MFFLFPILIFLCRNGTELVNRHLFRLVSFSVLTSSACFFCFCLSAIFCQGKRLIKSSVIALILLLLDKLFFAYPFVIYPDLPVSPISIAFAPILCFMTFDILRHGSGRDPPRFYIAVLIADTVMFVIKMFYYYLWNSIDSPYLEVNILFFANVTFLNIYGKILIIFNYFKSCNDQTKNWTNFVYYFVDFICHGIPILPLLATEIFILYFIVQGQTASFVIDTRSYKYPSGL